MWHWSQIAKVLKPLSLSSPNLLLDLNRFEEKQLSQLNQFWWLAYQWSRAISKKQTELNASAIRGNRWLINSATNQPTSQPTLLLYSYSTELEKPRSNPESTSCIDVSVSMSLNWSQLQLVITKQTPGLCHSCPNIFNAVETFWCTDNIGNWNSLMLQLEPFLAELAQRLLFGCKTHQLISSFGLRR